jgi:hypothetical protein
MSQWTSLIGERRLASSVNAALTRTEPTGVRIRFVIGDGWSVDNLDATLLDAKSPREGTSRCSGSEVSLEYVYVDQPMTPRGHPSSLEATAKLDR